MVPYQYGKTRRPEVTAPAPRTGYRQPAPPRVRRPGPIEIVHHCTAPPTRKQIWAYPCDCITDSGAGCRCAVEFEALRSDTIQIRITDACCWRQQPSNVIL